MKSTKIKTALVLGHEGHGNTVTEAKNDAKVHILALSQGGWLPYIIEWRGEAIMVYRTLTGWEYSWVQHHGGTVKRSGICIGDGTLYTTRKDAERAVVAAAWQPEDPINLFPEWFEDVDAQKDLISHRNLFLTVVY